MLQGEHSAILLTCIKLPFVIKIFVLSIFEWLFYTGFTVVSLLSLEIWSCWFMMAKINLVSNLNSKNIDTIVTLYTFCMANVIVVVAIHAFNKALCYFKGYKVNCIEGCFFSPLPASYYLSACPLFPRVGTYWLSYWVCKCSQQILDAHVECGYVIWVYFTIYQLTT